MGGKGTPAMNARRAVASILALLLVLSFAAGCSDSDSRKFSSTATPTATPPMAAPTVTFDVMGTINGEPAEGLLVLGPRVLPNPIPEGIGYEVVSFELDGLHGSGEGELIAFNDLLTLRLTLTTADGVELHVSGRGQVEIGLGISAIPDFLLTGDGTTIVFTAVASGGTPTPPAPTPTPTATPTKPFPTIHPTEASPTPTQSAGYPDLVITAATLGVGGAPPACGPILYSLEVCVRNQGNANAGTFSLGISPFFTGADNFVEWQRIHALAAGGETCVSGSTNEGVARVIADSEDEVVESEETNNVFEHIAVGQTPAPPFDCSPTSVPTPDSPSPTLTEAGTSTPTRMTISTPGIAFDGAR